MVTKSAVIRVNIAGRMKRIDLRLSRLADSPAGRQPQAAWGPFDSWRWVLPPRYSVWGGDGGPARGSGAGRGIASPPVYSVELGFGTTRGRVRLSPRLYELPVITGS